MSTLDETLPRCTRHPKVETALTCASCGTPVCPDCMVQAPVGIKCPTCAKQPRSALVRLKPERALRAVAAVLAVGALLALLLSALQSFSGFFGLFVAYGVGRALAEIVNRTAKSASTEAGVIAGLGCVYVYMLAWQLGPLLFKHVHTVNPAYSLVFAAVAAFIAFREVT